jgi:hypothetical protein
MGRFVLVALLGACSFQPRAAIDDGDGGASTDPPPDDATASPIDATACSATFLDVCSQPEATEPFVVNGTDAINTDTDPRCRTVTQSGGGDVCLVYATDVSIGSGSILTATGSRPLAIASMSAMIVDGAINVASQRVSGQTGPGVDDASCNFGRAPDDDAGGAGGGAGGTFAAAGGNGGIGDTDNSSGNDNTGAAGERGTIVTTVTVLRGGCRGQQGGDAPSGGSGGPGGHSGGALYLYAPLRIAVSGAILATGAGGEGGGTQAGGGGGGSGGLVVIESGAIAIAGQISANGGGGGQGGARYINLEPPDFPGDPGLDGGLGVVSASGGQDASPQPLRGFGGSGGIEGAAATDGATSIIGAGAGGGSIGAIDLIGVAMVTGVVTPAPR